ncbi:MAG: fumarylacetoacetate hydrolase family protein [Dethiobacteria bacterium]|jgi:2-keto-4-pentenoate hydratase/2-oxohepta-3-ene-1,7-dioic acid hydratase in catechol pathway
MKIVRFRMDARDRWGILEDKLVHEITWKGIPPGDYSRNDNTFPLETLQLLPPCLPTKIICVGLNYRCHAEEVNMEIPKVPIIFLKPSTAVIGPGEQIVHPPQSRRVDYEAELGLVIGKKAKNVVVAKARDFIWGYTCANDVTARDLQPKNGQWTYSKSFDTFAPLGPWIETEIEDPHNLKVSGILNGREVQRGWTGDFIFSIEELVAFISACMTLLPGDVIMTGTPAGIGPIRKGDTFTVKIDGIGELSNGIK